MEATRHMSAPPDRRPAGSLTAALLESERDTLARIADEPFLSGLAEGSLTDACLDAWLCEDWHFVTSMRRTLGVLVHDGPDEETVDLVGGAFPVIRAELDRFEGEIERRGLDVGPAPGRVVADFNAAVHSAFSAGPASALASYWALEHAYWWAWSRIRERIGISGPYGGWIDNWSSPEFAAFVGELADLVDRHSELSVAAPIVRDVFARERRLWRYLWDIGTGPPAI
jgi:thiaminase/transcriptional activator TenA